MKIRDLFEGKESKKIPPSKPRDPNTKTLQSIRSSGAAGAHKDKKKAMKQGDVKHKGKVMAESAEPNISTLDAVFNEQDFYRLENIWPALEEGDKEEALRQINHYLRKGKNRAWWGDLQALDIKIDQDDIENSQIMWNKPIQGGVAEGSLEEYGDTAKGQKMLTKVQKRATDRMIKADDKRDAKAAKKNQDTANRAWDRMTDKD